MSSINLVIAASIALLLTVLSIRAAPIASPTTEKIEKPSNLKQIPAKLPEQIKNTEARLLNKSPNQPSSKVPAAKPLGANKVENSAISEKMQQKLKLDLVKPRPDQIRPQPDQVRPQLEQDDQLTSEYSNTEERYPARNRLLEASYQQQPQLMDQSLEFGGIAPPSAAANYLILTGDFTGFEKAISDLLSIGMMTEEDAVVYRAEVGQEYDNLMNQLLLEYNGNEQNKPSYEPANTIYDDLSSPQLSIPEIVDYPEAAEEDDEQQQMQQQQQIQEQQLQNEYLDQLLLNILDASWKDQDSSVQFNPENEETIERNPETGDSSSDDSSVDSSDDSSVDASDDSSVDSNLEEQLQSIADPRYDSNSSNEAKEEMELQQLANDIAQAVKYQQNNDTKDRPKSEQSNDKSTETKSSSAVEKRSQS